MKELMGYHHYLDCAQIRQRSESPECSALDLYNAGCCWLLRYQPGNALPLFREAHRRGNVYALIQLGHLFRIGRGDITADRVAAKAYYRSALALGNSEGGVLAYFTCDMLIGDFTWGVADFFAPNCGTQTNDHTDRDLHEAARLGHPEAQYRLGCYTQTFGGQVSFEHIPATFWSPARMITTVQPTTTYQPYRFYLQLASNQGYSISFFQELRVIGTVVGGVTSVLALFARMVL